ncbi:MAG: 2Fe-2S iron-sulfur cluster-binding protein [Vicinamibacterales bacterium]
MEYGHIQFTLNGETVHARQGQSIVEAARENGIYIPTLCDYKSLPPAGTCRVCTVMVGGRVVAGCTTPAAQGMVVVSESPELADLRKGLIEMLFVEGNHMCPSCEKSGNCQLQALAYRYRMDVPRFPFSFTNRSIDASLPHLILEHNRCIQCLRCVRGVKGRGGEDIFGFKNRGRAIQITVDTTVPDAVTEETARKAMEICPVGALLTKGPQYLTPIGERTYDRTPIGSDIEDGRTRGGA